MRLTTGLLLLITLILNLAGCGRSSAQPAMKFTATTEPVSGQNIECHNGVVVTVSARASEAGLSILMKGGNAVDAAVATAFALAVTYPPAGNLGGGGFMLVHPAAGSGAPVVFDYRETAPAAAWPTMYTKEESQHTHRAVATPGSVRGLELAHRRFGKLPWAQLLSPAITLARDGFEVDANLAASMNETLADSKDNPEFQRVFGKPTGEVWKEGDRLVQPDLARTLELLAGAGPDAFYTGPIAEQIIAEMVHGGGLISREDLARYQAIERQPLTTRYHGYDVYVPPPPSSGGTCLIEELNMLETFDLKSWGRWSPRTAHVMAETMRRASYDRARYIGDPAFVAIPPNLITREYAAQLASTIVLTKPTSSEELSKEIVISHEGDSTTQFSIIDRDGMAVANTYTLERLWGSRVVVRGMGFLLNNQMRAFNLFPGITDTKGTIGTAPNVIAPGKRPISSMSPTIVAKAGRVQLVTGSPGSQAIPNTILCVILNVFDFDIPLKAAVEAPRMSHQWLPDQISFERPGEHAELVKALINLGHVVGPPAPLPFQGDAHSIFAPSPNDYFGVADQRRSEKASAAGF